MIVQALHQLRGQAPHLLQRGLLLGALGPGKAQVQAVAVALAAAEQLSLGL